MWVSTWVEAALREIPREWWYASLKPSWPREVWVKPSILEPATTVLNVGNERSWHAAQNGSVNTVLLRWIDIPVYGYGICINDGLRWPHAVGMLSVFLTLCGILTVIGRFSSEMPWCRAFMSLKQIAALLTIHPETGRRVSCVLSPVFNWISLVTYGILSQFRCSFGKCLETLAIKYSTCFIKMIIYYGLFMEC